MLHLVRSQKSASNLLIESIAYTPGTNAGSAPRPEATYHCQSNSKEILQRQRVDKGDR